MVLPPSCVRLLSRNFSKMHCFRIPEAMTLELGETEKWDRDVPWLGQVLVQGFVRPAGDGDDGLDGSATTGVGREMPTATESSKYPT